MYRVGIIGLGHIAVEDEDCHLRAYQECADTEVVAMCDKKAFYCARNWDSSHSYLAYMLMIMKEQLDIVSVCTPPSTHAQIVCDIAPYVKAILCEKPIALTLKDADKMIDTCRKHGTLLQINHQRASTIPRARFSRGFINTGTHMFEMLTRLFGPWGGQIGHLYLFGNTYVGLEYIDTDEHIFELDCTHTEERMITGSVRDLIFSLETKRKPTCSGEDGREALRLALEFKKSMPETKFGLMGER